MRQPHNRRIDFATHDLIFCEKIAPSLYKKEIAVAQPIEYQQEKKLSTGDENGHFRIIFAGKKSNEKVKNMKQKSHSPELISRPLVTTASQENDAAKIQNKNETAKQNLLIVAIGKRA